MKIDAMSGGLPIRRIHELAREGQDAEFSGLWITEGGRSAFNLCTAAARATGTPAPATASARRAPRRAQGGARQTRGRRGPYPTGVGGAAGAFRRPSRRLPTCRLVFVRRGSGCQLAKVLRAWSRVG